MVDLSILADLSLDARVVELHAHSNASDGLNPPEKVVRRARRAGLRVLALTDHDTVAGVARAHEEASRQGVVLVPGVELSCAYMGRSVHLLGHFIRPDARRLAERLEGYASMRVRRMEEMLVRLARLGVVVGAADFFAACANSPSITRGQLGTYLVEKGLVRSREEVFREYIGEDAPAYVELEAVSPFEALDLIRGAGGVATLAHPALSGCDDAIPAFAEAGLVGIEVEHPAHDAAARSRYRKLAAACGLLPTGGSDCHGVRGRERLGRHAQPLHVVRALFERAEARRARLERR